jgi:hypothetical protein
MGVGVGCGARGSEIALLVLARIFHHEGEKVAKSFC